MTFRLLHVEPLTAAAFAPFGDVMEASGHAPAMPINYGNTLRFHDLATLDLAAEGGRAGLSIFRSKPVPLPFTLEVMEYHPKSSQAFMPLSGRPYLVIVAPKGRFDAGKLCGFHAQAHQGVNYHAGTWHHFSLALEAESDFLVVDRIATDDNCVEHRLTDAEKVTLSLGSG